MPRQDKQEKTDNATKSEIARLADELASRPMRVRVVTASVVAPQVTLLPESNSRRLRAAISYNVSNIAFLIV